MRYVFQSSSLPGSFVSSYNSQHISKIRDFCDGLEYQVQFNDFRMLEELEKEGGSFFRLVDECLRREGRLNAEEDAPSTASSNGGD